MEDDSSGGSFVGETPYFQVANGLLFFFRWKPYLVGWAFLGGAGGVPLVSDWCFFKGAWRIGILHFEKKELEFIYVAQGPDLSHLIYYMDHSHFE